MHAHNDIIPLSVWDMQLTAGSTARMQTPRCWDLYALNAVIRYLLWQYYAIL